MLSLLDNFVIRNTRNEPWTNTLQKPKSRQGHGTTFSTTAYRKVNLLIILTKNEARESIFLSKDLLAAIFRKNKAFCEYAYNQQVTDFLIL